MVAPLAWLTLEERTWRAAGHAFASPFGWWTRLVAGLLVLGLGMLLARAYWQRRAYRVAQAVTPADVQRLQADIARAEQSTTAQLAVVVLERSEPHAVARWRAAVLLGFLGTAALVPLLPWHDPRAVLGAEATLLLLGALAAFFLPGVARAFLTEREADRAAEEQAVVEFHRQGMDRTAQRHGVLLFVSLFERRAIVLGDRDIDTKIGSDAWLAIDMIVVEGARSRELTSSLAAAIERLGAALAEHFPRIPDGPVVGELPDRVVVRRG